MVTVEEEKTKATAMKETKHRKRTLHFEFAYNKICFVNTFSIPI